MFDPADPDADPLTRGYVESLVDELSLRGEELKTGLATKVIGTVARTVLEGSAVATMGDIDMAKWNMWELAYYNVEQQRVSAEVEESFEIPTELQCGLRPGSRIGSGGYGTVYKAIDDTGTVFAVKVIREVQADDAQREYETLKMLSHRNIVKVWDFKNGDGVDEIIMSYWTQGSVAHQLQEFGKLPLTTVKRYAVQVLSGLAYLHSCGVIHADIKPANMLVDAIGSVALTDFGLCRLALAGTGVPAGTPPYMSPAAFGADNTVDPQQHDIWALGCSILEMATGLRPWPTASVTEFGQWWYFIVKRSKGMAPYDDLPPGVVLDTGLKAFGDSCFACEGNSSQDLQLHPFLIGRAARPQRKVASELWSEEQDIAALYRQGELSQSEIDSLIGENSPLWLAAPYKRGICRAGAPEDKRFSNQGGLQHFPSKYRPAYNLLAELGRNDDRELIELGTPNVVLGMPLAERTDEETVVRVCAAGMEKRYHADKERHPDPAEVAGMLPGVEDVRAVDVYGEGVFTITVGELKRLAASTFVSTSGDFSRTFLKDLTAVLIGEEVSSLAVASKYWSLVRATSLQKIGCEDEDGMEELTSALSCIVPARDHPEYAALHIKEWAAQYTGFAPKVERLQEHIRTWCEDVKVSTFEHGFPSSADAKAVLEQSIGELCNSTCTSQQGYFLVEGCYNKEVGGYSYNQLTEKTPVPITFLAAAGIDFRKPAVMKREMPKYFERKEDGKGWGDFRPLGEHSLKQRVKNIYRSVFECATHYKVRCMSMLPMGLGVFLLGIPEEHKGTVRQAYFAAQFELLFEEDWGFEDYYLNVTNREEAAGVLREVAKKQRRPLGCTVILHSRDTKFLAVELAKLRKRVGMLCPSDCSALMWGVIGAQWEIGRYDLYTGEQDICAHSTSLLAHANIRA